jgi:serine/threonine protein kinase
MLVGRLPFLADKQGDPSGLFSAILEGRYQPARQVRAELPAEIDDWFSHMLAVSPDERFDTLQAAAAALSNVCEAHATARSRVTTLHLPKETEPARSARRLGIAVCTALATAALVYLFSSRGQRASVGSPSQRDVPAQARATPPKPADSSTQSTLNTAQAAAADLPLLAAETADTPMQPSAADATPSTAQPSAAAPLPAAASAKPLANRNPSPENKLLPAPKAARRASAPPGRKPQAAARQAPSHPATLAPLPKDRGF